MGWVQDFEPNRSWQKLFAKGVVSSYQGMKTKHHF
jgi:hypothetical protein